MLNNNVLNEDRDLLVINTIANIISVEIALESLSLTRRNMEHNDKSTDILEQILEQLKKLNGEKNV